MKVKKTTVIILCLTLLTLLLTSCWPASVADEMTITSAEGAGTRVFHMRLYKDGAKKLDGGGSVSNMFSDPSGGGNMFFPSGIDAVYDFLKANRPENVPEFTMTEQDEYYDFSYTITFDSIADFNEQCKKIAGDNWKGAAKEATLKADGDGKLTYTEDRDLAQYVSIWAVSALYDCGDGTLFNRTYADSQMISKASDMLETDSVVVNIGGTSTVYDYQKDKDATTITATGYLSGEPVQSEAPAQSEEPAQSRNTESKADAPAKSGNTFTLITIICIAVAVTAAAVGVVLFVSKKKK